MMTIRFFVLCVFLLTTAGCARNVPSIGKIGQRSDKITISEIQLVQRIQCELNVALTRIYNNMNDEKKNAVPGRRIDWIKEWGAKVNLDVQVQVKSTASPNFSVTEPLQNFIKVFAANGDVTVSRNRTTSAGLTFGSDITRTEKMGYFYAIADILDAPTYTDQNGVALDDAGVCGDIDLVPNNDLQIYDFLQRKMFVAEHPTFLGNGINQRRALEKKLIQKKRLENTPESKNKKDKLNDLEREIGQQIDDFNLSPDYRRRVEKNLPDDPKEPSAPFEVLTYQVNFIVTRAANFDPAWKLSTLAINPASAAFYNGQRIRTHTLLITFGPLKEGTTDTGSPVPSKSLEEQHSANILAQAVINALINQ